MLRCSKCEVKLEGEEPWEFPGAADDLEIIHTPGHTYGHIVLLHKPSKCGLLPSLFTCLNAVGYPLWVQARLSVALAACWKSTSAHTKLLGLQHVSYTVQDAVQRGPSVLPERAGWRVENCKGKVLASSHKLQLLSASPCLARAVAMHGDGSACFLKPEGVASPALAQQ